MKQLSVLFALCATQVAAQEMIVPLRGKILAPLEQSGKLPGKKELLFTEYNTILPQIASGGDQVSGGYYTLLTSTALTDQPANVAILFYDDSGNPLNMPVPQINADGTVCVECPPQFVPGVGGTLLPGQALGQAIVPSGGATRLGYAKFSSSPPVSVAVTGTFIQIVPGRPLFMTGIPPSYDLHQKAFFYTSDASGLTSSVALVAARGATNINLTFRSNLLTVQCSTSFGMAASSHRAFVLRTLLPCMAGNEGAVEIQGIGFAGLGIWSHDQGAFVTQPLVERLAPSCATSFCFTMPITGKLYIRVTKDDGGQWTFGQGTSQANYQPVISNTPSLPQGEVSFGTFAAGQVVHFGMFTTFGNNSAYGFSNSTDQPSLVAFTDTNNSLGRGGSAIEQTSPTTWIFHLDNSVSYLYDDDDNDIVMAVRARQ